MPANGSESDRGAYLVVEVPPEYCPNDPLQAPLNESSEGLPRNSTTESFSSQSTGDFSDDDDDDVTEAESSGVNWSGA